VAVPNEKRARQRALRDQKMAYVERQRRRRRMLRRAASATVVAAVVVGLILLLSSHSTPKKAATKPTTTTSASTTTTLANNGGAKPVCPPAAGTSKRVIAFTKAPPLCIPKTATFDATIRTDAGTFVVRMPAAASLAAVNNFVFLSRYHFYDGVVFQRVIPGFAVQGGDPTGSGQGGPGYSFTGNTPKSNCQPHCYALGAFVMANTGTPSSNGSQFFIVVGSAGEQLPPSYTTFGQVVSGMPVVQKIAADGNSNPSANGVPPKVLHHILTVTISQVAP
jgi:cyclophilin family peptidyl-prolyl cis-trans isomerase